MKSIICLLFVVALVGATPEVDVRAELAADMNAAIDLIDEQKFQVDLPQLPPGTYKMKKEYPHIFLNSKGVQGVMAIQGVEIEGLEAVKADLAFCPMSRTIVGNVCIEKFHIKGKACANLDFLGDEKCTIMVAKDAQFDITLTDVKMKNIRIPCEYCPAAKTWQLGQVCANTTIGELSGSFDDAIDGDGNPVSIEQFKKLTANAGYPLLREFMRALFNLHIPKTLVRQMLITAFSGIAQAR